MNNVNSENINELSKSNDVLKEIFNDILDIEKAKKYFEFNHNKEKVHINRSISTKERIQLSEMISKRYPNKEISSPFQLIFPLEKDKIDGIKKDLDTKGFYVLKEVLDENICNSIKSSLEGIDFHTRKSTKRVKGLNSENISSIKGNTAWVANQQDVIKIPEIQKIAFNENLLNLVGDFLGSEPILCQTNSWWSVANSTHRSNLSANSQMFHQDTAYLKFIKVFIYLTDVNENNGPHQYVQGTSKIAQEKLGDNYFPSDRVEDDKVVELFGEDNILTFTGKKGSIIIEDTFGLHKGTPVKEGSRLLVQLLYCNSLYFHASYSLGLEGLLPEVNGIAVNYPRMFSNFKEGAHEYNEEKFLLNNKRSFSQKVKDKIKSYL